METISVLEFLDEFLFPALVIVGALLVVVVVIDWFVRKWDE